MKRLMRKRSGQVLVISILAILVLFILCAGVVETGNLFYEKIHTQNIADSGAMEAGTWYARALNLTSLSNKILVVVAGVALAMTSATGPGAIVAVDKAITPVREMQDFFAGTGVLGGIRAMPWLCWSSVLLNGKRNNALSLAVFNVETFRDDKLPSFNLKRRTLSDLLDPAQLETKYYYVENSSGRRVNVPKIQIKTNKTGRIYQKETGKFVIKEQGPVDDTVPEEVREPLKKILETAGAVKGIPLAEELMSKLQFDIIETGPHTVLVGTYKNGIKQKLGTSFFMGEDGKPIEPSMTALALVRIDGGSMGFWDMDGASYSPHLDRVELPALAAFKGADVKELLKKADLYSGSGNGKGFSGIFGHIEKAEKFISDGVLLH